MDYKSKIPFLLVICWWNVKDVPKKNGKIVTNMADVFSLTDASACLASYMIDNLIHRGFLENNVMR